MTQSIETDIAIVGAGPAGLIAAAALATTGKHICLIDQSDPRLGADDTRSTAFLRPAIDLFQSIGFWPDLEPIAHRLKALRIVDLAGTPPKFRAERTFLPDELNLEEFGWNILNQQLKHSLLSYLEGSGNVQFAFGQGVARLFTRADQGRLSLTDGTKISFKLAIAADGRNSALRRLAEIPVTITRYGQKSLAFSVMHEASHDDISTEFYHEGGPFTMVPLGESDGRNCSAVVWMNQGPLAEKLLGMEPAEFDNQMMVRTAGMMGQMTLASRRGAFPIVTQRATTFTAQRVALMAEAAHVLPPIGAQGLNTSVGDVAALLDLAESHNDPGSESALATYSQSRTQDVRIRAGAIDLFNRVTRSGAPMLQGLRLGGLQAAYHIRPLRRGLMKSGMGPV